MLLEVTEVEPCNLGILTNRRGAEKEYLDGGRGLSGAQCLWY